MCQYISGLDNEADPACELLAPRIRGRECAEQEPTPLNAWIFACAGMRHQGGLNNRPPRGA